MQQDINALHQWSILNCLSFHPSQCKILPFNFECSQVLKLVRQHWITLTILEIFISPYRVI